MVTRRARRVYVYSLTTPAVVIVLVAQLVGVERRGARADERADDGALLAAGQRADHRARDRPARDRYLIAVLLDDRAVVVTVVVAVFVVFTLLPLVSPLLSRARGVSPTPRSLRRRRQSRAGQQDDAHHQSENLLHNFPLVLFLKSC